MAEYDLVYSTQTTDFESGKRYENPTYFNGRVTQSKGIKIIGDWPLVKEAYEAADIPLIEEGNAPKRGGKKVIYNDFTRGDLLKQIGELGGEAPAKTATDDEVIALYEALLGTGNE